VGNDLPIIILRVLICGYWFAGNDLQFAGKYLCGLFLKVYGIGVTPLQHVPSSSSCCACLSLSLLFLQCCCDHGLSLHASLDVLFLRWGRINELIVLLVQRSRRNLNLIAVEDKLHI
jgi:hypothetical protein